MSTYSQGYASQNVTNDAEFRTRGKWISDRLTDCGWSIVTDSGTINWTTVSKPGTTHTVAGYEIRQSDNVAGARIYLKIEYGSGSTVTNMALWVTCGEGSDGAGTITGDKTTRTECITTAVGAVGCTDYVSGAGARLAVVMAANTSAGTMTATIPGFVIQRTTDASGVDDGNGFIVFMLQGGTGAKHEQVNFSTGSSSQRTGLGCMLALSAPVPGSAGAIPVFPIYVATAAEFLLARDIICIPYAHASLTSQHTFSLLGSNRTYIALWGNVTTSAYLYESFTAPVAFSVCIRWE
jgi:hypothetical protein